MINFGVGIAVLSAGKVLLTRREDFEVWCLPGGQVEAGESLAQAARREVFEETGLEVAVERLIGLYSRPHFINGGSHEALFAGRATGGALRPDPREVLEARWFSLQDLPAELLPWTMRQVRDALGGAGGSSVWRSDTPWPFPQEVKRADLYRMRDESGLTRAAFFHKFFSMDAMDEISEVKLPQEGRSTESE